MKYCSVRFTELGYLVDTTGSVLYFCASMKPCPFLDFRLYHNHCRLSRFPHHIARPLPVTLALFMNILIRFVRINREVTLLRTF